jgi:predicted Zn-ribbon and HTH transcriptional regulator
MVTYQGVKKMTEKVEIINPEDIPKLPQANCLRCGYTWNIRTEHPRRCPHCKSPYWDKPRKKEVK